MGVLSEQIKKYRMAKGVTQEQLGELVGVSTQAVSKWERGGTPDAEILPKLAEVLSVNIDALYGIGEENIPLTVARIIHRMSDEEAYPFAFNICWAIQNAMMHNQLRPEDLSDENIDLLTNAEDKGWYLMKIMRDEGMCVTRVSPDLNCFFMMKEPKNGIKKCFDSVENMSGVFKAFADEDVLTVLFYMYTRLNTPLSSSLISKNTGFSIRKVDKCMDVLCKANVAQRSVIETAEGEMYSYMFINENAVIPFLLYADEIAKRDTWEYQWSFSRTKPIFN